jgi:hypothetical protein
LIWVFSALSQQTQVPLQPQASCFPCEQEPSFRWSHIDNRHN